ncbi:ABC transporter permease [Mesomycoplasma moatsii]|uniref:ABC transporter permease n=1 Tax=Mesomycoplasma moatsii TaxID=171287 RepID=UPI000407B033
MEKEQKIQEIAVLELVNRHFWKSKIGPLSALIIPLFLMVIYKILSKNESSLFISGLPSYFSFSILPLCFISLPQMIVEFKTSIILRKIANSRITSVKFILIVILYNFTMILSVTFLIILLYAIFLNVNAKAGFEYINWYELIYSLLNVYICCLSIGLLLGVLINKNNLVQIIGFSLIMISVILSGQFIPISVLFRTKAVSYISLLSPVSYCLNQMNIVLLPNNSKTILELNETIGLLPNTNLEEKILEIQSYKYHGIFDFNHTFKIFDWSTTQILQDENNSVKTFISKIVITPIFDPWQNILNVIMPYLISILAIIISIKQFKWTSR